MRERRAYRRARLEDFILRSCPPESGSSVVMTSHRPNSDYTKCSPLPAAHTGAVRSASVPTSCT